MGQNEATDIIFFNDGSIIQGQIIDQQTGESITVKDENGNDHVYEWASLLKYTFKGEYVYTQLAEAKENKNSAYFEKQKNEYSAFGIGIGNAYGALGFQFQIRTGKIMGAGMHFGAGFIPGGKTFKQSFAFKVGAKFYYYKPLFIDLAYGTGAIDSRGNTYNGLSMLIGGDFIFTKVVGLNAGIGLSKDDDRYYPTFELGLLLKFNNKKK